MDHLIEQLEQFGSPRIALVGDFMLDRYVYGDVERINPEAPVPVLKVVRSESRVGGAGNVATAVIALGGTVRCVGVIGKDATGDELNTMLVSGGVETASLVRVPGHSTPVKTRYVGLAQHRHAQQMLRVDQEAVGPLRENVQNTLRAAVRSLVGEVDVVALEDYDKGVLDERLTPKLIEDARKAGRPVVVDPALIEDYRRYRGATLLTPNRYEAALASGIEITDQESLERAAKQVLLVADADAVLITLDKEGGYLLTRDGQGKRIPHQRPRSVYDITGAGDEVLAMLGVAVGEGCPFDQAAALANVAGGLEVERFGVVAIKRREILDELRRMIGIRSGKVLDRQRLSDEVHRRRERGETVVFTNGCFDLLHMGHIRFLRQARQLGSCLIVAINSDEGVRRLKGPSRPVIGADERAETLAALECVDHVIVFDEETSRELIELLCPDVFAKGGSTDVVVEREVAESCGARVVTLNLVQGYSTTEIINRVLDSRDESVATSPARQEE